MFQKLSIVSYSNRETNMKTFKKIALFNLFLLCFCETVIANEAQSANNPESTADKKPVNIKLSPNYKRSEPGAITSTYKKAIIIEVSKDDDFKKLQQIGEERCREYSLKQRQNYFVNLVTGNSAIIRYTVFCNEVEDLTPLEDSTKDSPSSNKVSVE